MLLRLLLPMPYAIMLSDVENVTAAGYFVDAVTLPLFAFRCYAMLFAPPYHVR